LARTLILCPILLNMAYPSATTNAFVVRRNHNVIAFA